MASQFHEAVETDEQHKQRLNAALVEALLDDWMLTADVCLSPLLGFDELNKNNNEPGIDEDDGGTR